MLQLFANKQPNHLPKGYSVRFLITLDLLPILFLDWFVSVYDAGEAEKHCK